MQTAQQVLDIAFPVTSVVVPLDHGYALYSGLSRVLPFLHDETGWGVHPIQGARNADSITTTPQSRIKLRIPASHLPDLVPLTGAEVDVAGARVTLGAPTIYRLIPAARLRARFVTIKSFADEPQPFADAVRRQLAHLPALAQDPERIAVSVGRRRVMRIAGQTIVGFAVELDGLSADASIAVQSHGLGGRRHMGAGMFVPPGRNG